MASGLQCPGCGHVHPAGLPEIARGDATFRCYGCYRTLSVPEGWTGRPSPRPSGPEPGPPGDAPAGAGTRDARAARLAGRRAARRGSGPDGPPGGAGGFGADLPTQMVPTAGRAAGASSAPPDWSAPGAPPAPGAAGVGVAGAGAAGGAGAVHGAGRAGVVGAAGRAGVASGGTAAGGAGIAGAPRAPLGWVGPRRSGGSVPTAIRALVWTVAFGVGLLVTAFALREVGLLGVNTAIDVYAGSGARRFGILLVMLPLWAVLSATIAHFSLESLARRRRPRHPSSDSAVKSPTG